MKVRNLFVLFLSLVLCCCILIGCSNTSNSNLDDDSSGGSNNSSSNNTQDETNGAESNNDGETVDLPDNFHIHSFNSSNVCEDCGESYEDNGLIFTKAANDLFHVTGYVGTASEVIIPSKFQGLPVAGIGYEAFAYKDVLVRVILPESIISISNNAFTNCENLTYISIPSNTTRIGNGVFASCNKLLQKENGVYYVDKWAVDCDEIATSVTLRSNTVGIANSAFYNCNSLTDVILPEGVLSICSGAFYNCAKLENINIPDSVIYIDSAVFSGCNALIESENGVNYVDRWVVGCNMTVDTVTLRKNTVGISTSALSGASITQINIPEGVKIIDRGAFNGCYNMVGVIIPKTVKTIGMGAFNNCDNLSTVYYTGSNSQWESIQIDSTNDSLTSASMVFNYIQ